MIKIPAKEVAARLKALGFPVLSVSEPSDIEDGEVVITDRVHIQVGYNYVNVVKQSGEEANLAFEFSEAAPTYEKLVADLRVALQPEN